MSERPQSLLPSGEIYADEESTQIVRDNDVGGFFAGRFRLDAKLGLGAVGRVLTAVDTQTGTSVALKVLHYDRASDPSVVARFRREAALLRDLDHPAIVRLVDFGQAPDGAWWLAMELLRGKTMKDTLAERGPLRPHDAWPIVATLCDAVEYAHSRQILHRDLKPENILMLEGAGVACKVLDFGLSRAERFEKVTATGTLLGTPRYMAPEMLSESRTLDARVDVFSLGAIVFELMTGRSIYTVEDFGALFGAILDGRTLKLRQVRPDASPALEAVIAHSVARNADERIASAAELANRFAHAIGVNPDRQPFLGGALGPPRRPPHAVPPRPPPPRAAPVPSVITAPPDAPTRAWVPPEAPRPAAAVPWQQPPTAPPVFAPPPRGGASLVGLVAGGLVATLLILALGGLAFLWASGRLDLPWGL